MNLVPNLTYVMLLLPVVVAMAAIAEPFLSIAGSIGTGVAVELEMHKDPGPTTVGRRLHNLRNPRGDTQCREAVRVPTGFETWSSPPNPRLPSRTFLRHNP